MVEMSGLSSFDAWRHFLSNFVRAMEAQQSVAIGEWRGLLSDFAGVRGALQTAIGQPSASRCTFNVFEVTRRSGFEVTTHSALLCDLLDPRGTHGGHVPGGGVGAVGRWPAAATATSLA
jgi:hypothetical protein